MTTTITIDTLEQLAAQIESDDAAQRAKLHRLITAYARIVAVRDPEKFRALATRYADVAGHSDNSYPPDQEYSEHTAPPTIRIADRVTEDIATSDGYYHSYRTVTTDPGLHIGRDGRLVGGYMTGTGRIGQFAAYPGDCDVDCTIDWVELDAADVPLDRLAQAEQVMRDIAFPLVAKAC